MSKRKANIRPELEGELFLKPGEDIPYRLILCNTEPTAVIQRVDNAEPESPTGLSGLSGLILLKPVRPIEKPKKPRADLGKPHKKRATVKDETEIADKKGDNLTIHVPTGLKGDTEYKINIAGSVASGEYLKSTIVKALGKWGGKIPDELTEQGQEVIQGILDAGEEK